MAASSKSGTPTVGFLTVIDLADQGLFGGYLVLTVAGRPLEFQCTAPVKPNRAQEILYGPALKPYLYGERIGQALLEKSKLEPLLVFTDVEPALSVREHCPMPVVWVGEGKPDSKIRRIDGPHSTAALASRLHSFELAGRQYHVPLAHERDEPRVTECWSRYAREFDVQEPFGRIREAIQEALNSAK